MADLPGHPAEPATCRNGGSRSSSRRSARCSRCRRRSPRPASSRPSASPFSAGRARRRRRTRGEVDRLLARRDVRSSPRSACCRASCRACVIDGLGAGRAKRRRRPHAGADRRSPGSRSCRSPRAAAPTTACWSSCSSRLARSLAVFVDPSLRLARRAARPRRGTAAFPIRARRRNTPPAASPSRSAACSARSSSARANSVDMPPPGDHPRRRACMSSCAISSGKRSTRRSPAPSAFAADRLNHLQFLTIRRYLSLSSPRSSCSFWCWRYGCDPRPRRPGRADAAGAAAGAAAHRLRAQGQGAAAAAARARRPPALSRSRCGCCARRWCWPTNASWLFRVDPLSDLRRDLGGGRAGADLRHRPAVQLVGRSHRHHRAARQRALLPGARRHGCRHQLRRHRLEPRGDDRLARRAGDAA